MLAEDSRRDLLRLIWEEFHALTEETTPTPSPATTPASNTTPPTVSFQPHSNVPPLDPQAGVCIPVASFGNDKFKLLKSQYSVPMIAQAS